MGIYFIMVNIVVQSLSHLSVGPWAIACQASLSFTISQSLLKLMSIESMMPSNHLILFLYSALNLSQHQGLFQWVGFLHQVAKVLELQLQHQSFSEYSWLTLFRIDWFDLLAIQGIQECSQLKAWVLWHSALLLENHSSDYMNLC